MTDFVECGVVKRRITVKMLGQVDCVFGGRVICLCDSILLDSHGRISYDLLTAFVALPFVKLYALPFFNAVELLTVKDFEQFAAIRDVVFDIFVALLACQTFLFKPFAKLVDRCDILLFLLVILLPNLDVYAVLTLFNAIARFCCLIEGEKARIFPTLLLHCEPKFEDIRAGIRALVGAVMRFGQARKMTPSKIAFFHTRQQILDEFNSRCVHFFVERFFLRSDSDACRIYAFAFRRRRMVGAICVFNFC